jgi:hypothetical protein
VQVEDVDGPVGAFGEAGGYFEAHAGGYGMLAIGVEGLLG